MPSFFEQPIINSPYEYPSRHWELDADRQPTNAILDQRRRAARKVNHILSVVPAVPF